MANICCELNTVLRCSHCKNPFCAYHMMKEGIDLYPENYKKNPYKLCGCRRCSPTTLKIYLRIHEINL